MSDPAPSTSAATEPRSAAPWWGPLGPTYALGFLGALLVLAGSFGSGWLAQGSAMNRWEWLIPVRTTALGVGISIALVTAGAWVMMTAWLRLGRRLRPWAENMRPIWTASILWSIPLLFCVPILSRDVFAYVGQGRIVLGGGDPYVQTISSVNNWLQMGTDVTWSDSLTAYGPVFFWLAAGIVWLSGINLEISILGFRLLAWVGILLLLVFVPKLARLYGANGSKAAWYTVPNPLLLISFVASSHNDALMAGLSVVAVYFAARRRGVLAIVFLVLSIAIKPITIVLLPFLGLMWAGPQAGWPKRIAYWAVSGGLTLGLLFLIGLPGGFGFGWVKATLASGTDYYLPYAPLGLMVAVVTQFALSFGLDSGWVLPVVQTGGRLVAVAIILYLILRGSYANLLRRMVLAFAALVVFSPVIHPWYLLWLLPFFAALGIRDDWQRLWVYATVAFFLAYGCVDQIYSWEFLRPQLGLFRMISLLTSIACCLMLVLASSHNRRAFVGLVRHPSRMLRLRGEQTAPEERIHGEPRPPRSTAGAE